MTHDYGATGYDTSTVIALIVGAMQSVGYARGNMNSAAQDQHLQVAENTLNTAMEMLRKPPAYTAGGPLSHDFARWAQDVEYARGLAMAKIEGESQVTDRLGTLLKYLREICWFCWPPAPAEADAGEGDEQPDAIRLLQDLLEKHAAKMDAEDVRDEDGGEDRYAAAVNAYFYAKRAVLARLAGGQQGVSLDSERLDYLQHMMRDRDAICYREGDEIVPAPPVTLRNIPDLREWIDAQKRERETPCKEDDSSLSDRCSGESK